MGFTVFGLSDHVLQGVQAAGYTAPTPIQTLALRPALDGRDVIGCAQTGTGKTAAFVLPILHLLARESAPVRNGRAPRALILTPTRELTQQVHAAVDTYGKYLSLRAISVYGGVSMDNQLKLLRRGTDIVIATPGRLLDHLQRKTIDLSAIQILVLDEADRMLDMGFIRDVRTIIAVVPKQRQTMLFSATISPEIRALAGDALRDPTAVEVGERHNPVETIKQYFYGVEPHAKLDLLVHALEKEKMGSVLVFSRTKHGADKICKRLERKGVNAVAIHSNRTQSQRDRALDGFRKGTTRVLVATDIAARGIDVDGISHVINYDIPHQPEDYIHRIGRTGRAGAVGDAITFIAREDSQYFRRIEQYVGKRIPVASYEGFVTSSTYEPAIARPNARPTGGSARRAYSPSPRKGQVHQGSKGKKRVPLTAARKKTPPPKLDSFSSHSGGTGWSNH